MNKEALIRSDIEHPESLCYLQEVVFELPLEVKEGGDDAMQIFHRL